MAAPLYPRGLHKKIYFHLFLGLPFTCHFSGKGSAFFAISPRFSRDALLIFVGRMSGGMFASAQRPQLRRNRMNTGSRATTAARRTSPAHGATIAAETAAPLPNLFCKAAGVLFPAEKSPTLSTMKFSPTLSIQGSRRHHGRRHRSHDPRLSARRMNGAPGKSGCEGYPNPSRIRKSLGVITKTP